MVLSKIALVLVAYLIGSIPTAVWIGKLFYNTDVREHGSGNAGATNTFRVLGKKAGIPVLIIDILKGTVSVLLVNSTSILQETNEFFYLQIALGIACLLGHIFPVFAGFRGGKGVATLLGIVIAIQPLAAIISMIIFLIVLIAFRYVSLASMIAGLSYPITVLTYIKSENNLLIAFSILVAILLVITHKRNIDRLLKKEESKINFGFVKTKSKN